ncbi:MULTISPECIES: DMT family transporter [Lactiplantibacillus]|jgi:small multidrug resistance pump|uniref:Multidrug efflux SMR transporter n=5 Tax=Lactiplantibacillus pentosus TaxID=1589 RepID=A0A241RR40_LACPE|nr:multidrug efflux SMR transporter [Lactiplantibacillus pentosus]KRK25427.1 quaternary ammonium compound-resistance protein [Lactiplantibacillus pentosus DSM 20314]MBU7448938.1 multidrug efflux SMR transporter [Lactiplantibacillus sp. 7.2.4]ASG80140.1 QacE family quaternary ammonium compound efflux SMR transporter [Lactiplantibacillus pentosus]AYG38536.1 QacE family quaternary ammonium compound efflux SMR transporter [Lactiplantibacillus pentosus]AYG41196.1 QacE family quaternary ammonium com
MMRAWIQLVIAIGVEIVGTSLLKLSAGFKHPLVGILGMLLYGLAIFSFSLALRKIPLSIGYAIWAGVGTAVTGLIGIWAFGEVLTGLKTLGFMAIIMGVVLLNKPLKAPQTAPTTSRTARWRARYNR